MKAALPLAQSVSARVHFMRLTVLIAVALLGGNNARAFECTNITVPSSFVICSDPELMRLGDQRQAALNDARGRIGEDARPALWEDQKVWVRSYATACGVPPDRPAPLPVPPSVRACFRRAAEARIAYIQRYGLVSDSAPVAIAPGGVSPDRVGPGFDCSKVTAPLALMICAERDLSLVDFRFNQAYWALLQQLGPAGQRELKEDDIAFIDQVQEQCGVPRSGQLNAETWRSRDCVKDAYQQQRDVWLTRLRGPAREEATRPPETHTALQKILQQLGYIPPGPINGVYVQATRNGIAAWQSARGLPVSGLLGEAEARMIEREAMPSLPRDRAQLSPPAPGVEEIPLKKDGGVYVVGVRINRAITLDFIVDSGASDVQIPFDVAMTLARAGTVSRSDFIGDREYRIGDGSTLRSDRFILRELEVGGRVMQSVVASIGPAKSDLLLGQSFLARFRSWSVDNSRHVLVLGELVP
jgi:uncharacterized protein/predicted aspartyl protease